jgi:hypothetical protein
MGLAKTAGFAVSFLSLYAPDLAPKYHAIVAISAAPFPE